MLSWSRGFPRVPLPGTGAPSHLGQGYPPGTGVPHGKDMGPVEVLYNGTPNPQRLWDQWKHYGHITIFTISVFFSGIRSSINCAMYH